jgi:hypothetical protein
LESVTIEVIARAPVVIEIPKIDDVDLMDEIKSAVCKN